MLKLIKIAVIAIAVVGAAGIVVPGYCAEQILVPAAEKKVISSVAGEVVSVDVEKAAVTIKVLKDAATNAYENSVISVLLETKIIKAETALKLADLKAGDKLIVNYVNDASGKQTIKDIIVVVK